MNPIKIMATTKEGWDIIRSKLDLLPPKVLEQIESAESSFSITCNLRSLYGDKKDIFIPHELVTQITDFGDYIGIYCGDYFFKAPKASFNYTYIFIKSTQQ